jgi:gamma-glutamyltranspeptidase / glutathione hydrolase
MSCVDPHNNGSHMLPQCVNTRATDGGQRRLRRLAASLMAVLAAASTAHAAQPVRARHEMVVTREKHATHVGLGVLEKGGNAIDAAAAVGLALAVTHPSAGNLGGGGFMLIRLADGRATFLDFRERAPRVATRNMYLDAQGKATQDSVRGYRASGVPGTVAGLEYAAKKYGTRPWAELVHPAVQLAEKGFPVSFGLAESLRSSREKLAEFPESKRIFLRDGRYYEADEIFRQPELAHTLERIEKLGSSDFYSGETARRLAADMAAHGGTITLEDLKTYKVHEREPLTGSYRGYRIVTAPPPSSGGVGILQMLGMLEDTGFEKAGPGSAAMVHFMAEAMRRYFADRSEHLADPDFVAVPVTKLLDPAYIARRRATIDADRATPSSQTKPAAFGNHESDQTTHYTIADRFGNVVAVTYTLNGSYGSKVTPAGLGFLLNNEMDDFAPKPGEANMYGLVQGESNAVAPGKTPLSSMTPTLVLKDGKPFLAVGSPGGPTIINTVLETIVNAIDFGMNAQDAVNSPRFHHQWLPDELRMEPGFSPDTVALLTQRGYSVKRINLQGEAAAIRWHDGWLEGAPDPRTEATAEGH